MSKSSGFNPIEKKAAFSISLLIAIRMYGLFLIMPVFSVYAKTLPYSTPMLIAIALGVYGLTQAILQIPLGLASDFYGRKKILTIGLLVFIAGSISGDCIDCLKRRTFLLSRKHNRMSINSRLYWGSD